MIFHAIAIGSIIWMNASTSIRFPKINPDSVVEIWPSAEGYTSRSTNAIIVGMKNGDTITALYDKDGGLAPLTLRTSPNKAWFTIFNPKFAPKKGNCSQLLCSLAHGMCKCGDVVADSGYVFEGIPDSTTTGWKLSDKRYRIRRSRKNQKMKPDIILTEEEIANRFLDDFNKSPRIR